MGNAWHDKWLQEREEEYRRKDEAFKKCREATDSGVPPGEAVLDMVLELLHIETGLEKEFFRTAPQEEVEAAIGIPRYRISRDTPGKRRGYPVYEKHDSEYHFDVNLLYKKKET